jgi:AraC family transcriptional regulator
LKDGDAHENDSRRPAVTDELTITYPRNIGIADYPPGASFGPRILRDHELVWMIEGEARYRRGGMEVVAPRGAVILCRPGENDAFHWDPHRATRHAYFHFTIQSVPQTWPDVERWPLVRLPFESSSTHCGILAALFRHLLVRPIKEGDLQLGLTVKLLLTAFVMGETATGDAATGGMGTFDPSRRHLPEAVDRALAFIDVRLREQSSARISLQALADAACVTPEHLCRLFKRATSRSPAQTVRLARLDRASALVARSNYSFAQIADLFGFADAFHFSRQFKRAFGIAPSALRNEARSGRPASLLPIHPGGRLSNDGGVNNGHGLAKASHSAVIGLWA